MARKSATHTTASATMAEASEASSEPDPKEIAKAFPLERLHCPVCLDLYVQPKIIPCGHIICASCLINWLRAHNQRSRCPLCRARITEDGPCRLSSDSSAEELSDTMPTEENMHALVVAHKALQPPHVCSKCGEEANSFCFECYRKFCKKCRRKHTKVTNKKVTKLLAKMEATPAANDGSSPSQSSDLPASLPYVPPRRHRVQPLASLSREIISIESPSHCKVHTAEEDNYIDYYCDTHSALLCLRCVKDGGHNGCVFKTIKVKAEEGRQILQEISERLELKKKKLQEEKEKIVWQEEQAKKLAAESRAEITNMMDNIQGRLRQLHTKFQEDMHTLENTPPEERIEYQTTLLHDFKDSLHNIVSLDRAEAAIRRFDDFTRENSSNPTRGAGTSAALRQLQHLHHHHHHSHHHNHPVQPSPPAATGNSAPAATGEEAEEPDSIGSFFQEITRTLHQAISPSYQADNSSSPPAPSGESD